MNDNDRDITGSAGGMDTQHLTELRARLASEAAQRGLVDVAYAIVETPLGKLLLAETQHGLVRVAFEREDFATVLQTLADRVGVRVLEDPDRLAPAAAELTEYFERRRTVFDLRLDHSLSAGFRGEVQRLLPTIGYGHTSSYAQLADVAGRPRASRAVGTACATNPLPIVVPCHRVLRSDGSLGGYVGGLDAKRALLQLESAA